MTCKWLPTSLVITYSRSKLVPMLEEKMAVSINMIDDLLVAKVVDCSLNII